VKRRPGFLSPLGLTLAALLVAAAGAWTHLAGGSLFSPGALNAVRAEPAAASLGGVASHAEVEDCGACHPAPWSSAATADRCLDCHRGVGEEIEAGDGLHGRLPGLRSAPTCGGCHPEHNGPDGALTSLDASFPHDVTGFSLRTHAQTPNGNRFACADCHANGYPPFEDAVCADCHRQIDAAFTDRHAETYGAECLACHDGSGRDGAGFDHETTGFALEGEHAGSECEGCHAGARSRRDLEATPQACYACHAGDDEHEGAYGQDCGQCHAASAWEDVTFDHSVFPLDHGSEERTASCQTCHPTTTRRYTCYGCHEHSTAEVLDEHEGRSLTELEDCVRCHPGGREADEGEED
jgi:hypothetical protein